MVNFQDHGADCSITDNENRTAINHAITEKHYNLIPIFQNHVFEKKIQKKIDTAKMPLSSQLKRTPKKAIDKVVKSFERLEINKSPNTEHFLTPNRTNYNFKEASPFLVNINMRPRRKRYEEKSVAAVEKLNSKQIDSGKKCDQQETKETVEIIEISDSDDSCDDQNDTKRGNEFVKNLFELTEENIEKHLTTVIKKRRKDSLITAWRNKVNESRQRKSILPIAENDFEAFLSEHTVESESQSVESSQQSIETIVAAKEKSTQNNRRSETEDSFITAPEANGDAYVIERDLTAKKDQTIEPENKTAIILQTQEKYEHFDPEDNIVFYENKLLVNPIKTVPKSTTENDVIILNTSSESGTCTDLVVPSDYDTDDLRKELRQYGDVPGPITKNTKRLYLKRLIRYKRKPKQTSNNSNQMMKCSKLTFFSEYSLVNMIFI